MTTTQPSTLCEPGAVVVIRFQFTSQAAVKRRPAIILTDEIYHASRVDAIMMPLSSRAGGYYGDTLLNDWKSAGLDVQTTAKGVIQTIERAAVEKRIGTLSTDDFDSVKANVKTVLGL